MGQCCCHGTWTAKQRASILAATDSVTPVPGTSSQIIRASVRGRLVVGRVCRVYNIATMLVALRVFPDDPVTKFRVRLAGMQLQLKTQTAEQRRVGASQLRAKLAADCGAPQLVGLRLRCQDNFGRLVATVVTLSPTVPAMTPGKHKFRRGRRAGRTGRLRYYALTAQRRAPLWSVRNDSATPATPATPVMPATPAMRAASNMQPQFSATVSTTLLLRPERRIKEDWYSCGTPLGAVATFEDATDLNSWARAQATKMATAAPHEARTSFLSQFAAARKTMADLSPSPPG